MYAQPMRYDVGNRVENNNNKKKEILDAAVVPKYREYVV